MITPLIQLGKFILNSGRESDYKLIADDFIADNLDSLAMLIRRVVGPFGAVQGIPRGGLLIAEALGKLASVELPNTLLIVDDVLTTGGSMRRSREYAASKYEYIVGAVVFARGPCPTWITPLFQLPDRLWLRNDNSI